MKQTEVKCTVLHLGTGWVLFIHLLSGQWKWACY